MKQHHPSSGQTAFANPDALSAALSMDVATSLIASAGDIALVLDDDGTIIDVAISNSDLTAHGFADWIGRGWADTVTVESKPKIAEMLTGAGDHSAPRWRQVNHMTANGDVPVRYLVMKTSGDSAPDGHRSIAIGRDMRAAAAMQQRLLQTQQSLERDYIQLRQAEARYRLLFDMAIEPMLIVDAASRNIREVNAAAQRLLGTKDGALAGRGVGRIAEGDDREKLIAHLGAAGAADDLAPVSIQLAWGQGEAQVSARLFRQGRTAQLLVRILPVDGAADGHRHDAVLADVVEHMPDAFVLTDGDLNILTANASFVELAQMPSADRVIGMGLGSWLGRPAIDLDLIAGQLREHGSVRNVATILRGSSGGQEEVEVSGVSAPHGDGVCHGFTIRHVGRRLRDAPAIERDLPRSVEQLTELVGRMSLKEIVRESTDLIERLCIEAALAYTSDNRAFAAEILGVSRQNLYSKLHRHGLGNLVSGDN